MRLAVLLAAAVPAALALSAAPAHAQGSDPVTFRPGRGTMGAYQARVRNEVDGVKQRWAQAWESDDARALTELYTRDAVVVRPGGEAVRTPGEIRAAFERELPVATNLQTKPVSFHTSGDLAYEVGTMTYVVERPGATAELRSTVYFLVFQRQGDSSWKIQSQMTGDPVTEE